jgi:hypothetical protein
MWFDIDVLDFQLNLNEDILTFLATLSKNWVTFNQFSGHTGPYSQIID